MGYSVLVFPLHPQPHALQPTRRYGPHDWAIRAGELRWRGDLQVDVRAEGIANVGCASYQAWLECTMDSLGLLEILQCLSLC
jgi:hypothetical protein